MERFKFSIHLLYFPTIGLFDPMENILASVDFFLYWLSPEPSNILSGLEKC